MNEVLFSKIIREIAPMTERILFHVKGEPLLHPDIEKFLYIAGKENSKIELTTNGVLIKDAYYLLNYPSLVQINFSLHSLLSAYKDEGVEKALEILDFTKRASEIRPDLYINLRFWDMDNIISVPDNEILTEIKKVFHFNLAEINIKERKKFNLHKRISLNFDTQFIWPSYDNDFTNLNGFCYGLNSHFAVLACGTVIPCCLDGEGILALGNINEMPLNVILKSERALNIKEGFNSFQLREKLCRKCGFVNRFKKIPAKIK